MNRMLTFTKYLLAVVVFYFFVDYMCFVGINTTYKEIKNYTIEIAEPKVQINEAKVTTINGYIKGNIENNTNDTINEKYLKINLLADNGVNLGEKFVEINKLEKNEKMDFDMRFNIQNVKNFRISIVDSVEGASEEALISDSHYGFFTLTTLLITLYIL